MASDLLGSKSPEIENSNGFMFRQFLEVHELYASSTFFASGPTWTSSYGTKHRLD